MNIFAFANRMSYKRYQNVGARANVVVKIRSYDPGKSSIFNWLGTYKDDYYKDMKEPLVWGCKTLPNLAIFTWIFHINLQQRASGALPFSFEIKLYQTLPVIEGREKSPFLLRDVTRTLSVFDWEGPKMTIAVFGGTGYIGRAAAAWLSKKGTRWVGWV